MNLNVLHLVGFSKNKNLGRNKTKIGERDHIS